MRIPPLMFVLWLWCVSVGSGADGDEEEACIGNNNETTNDTAESRDCCPAPPLDDDKKNYCGASSGENDGSCVSALAEARLLQPPTPQLTYDGAYENSEFWDEHEVLFKAARQEWGRKHPQLYVYNETFVNQFLDPNLVKAITNRDKKRMTDLIEPADQRIPFVYSFQLFTPEFTRLFLEEMQHQEDSGIPLRRPNSMNRFGAILEDLGFKSVFDELVPKFVVPIARHLFPSRVGPDDLVENYPFLVRYQPGQDVTLSEHSDSSLVTINMCLEPVLGNKKVLYFKENLSWKSTAKDNPRPRYMDHSVPGRVVMHMGQHRHGVAGVESSRSNLIVWMYGEWGYVRYEPYTSEETLEHHRVYEEYWKEQPNRRRHRKATADLLKVPL